MQHTILLFFSFFIEAVILWLYASNLFISAHSARIKLGMISFLYSMLFCISLLEIIWLNIAVYFLINILFFSTQFKLKLPSAFFHSAILTAIMGISELAVFGVISRFAPHFVITEGVEIVLYTVFGKILFLATIYFLIHLFKGKNTPKKRYDRSDFFLMLIPASSIFIMFTFFSIGETSVFTSPHNIMVSISAIFLLIMNLLVFGINQYNQKKSLEFTEMQLLLQKESDSAKYYEMLLSQNENQSILIHDIKKHLQSLQLLNESKEYDKVNIYIHQLLDSANLKEALRLCDNEMLNAILSRYQRECREKHISFYTDIRSGTVHHIHQHDLTSLFCNLLDNAVEASENIPDSFIEISIQKNEKTSFIIIVVINSCRNTPEYDPNGFPISRKSASGRHGYGIKSIRKVIKQYNGNLQMYYDSVTATFHTIITLDFTKE